MPTLRTASRSAVAEAFGDLVEGRWPTVEEARAAGRQVLTENARQLYRL